MSKTITLDTGDLPAVSNALLKKRRRVSLWRCVMMMFGKSPQKQPEKPTDKELPRQLMTLEEAWFWSARNVSKRRTQCLQAPTTGAYDLSRVIERLERHG